MRSSKSPLLGVFTSSGSYTKMGGSLRISLTKQVSSIKKANKAVEQLRKYHPELVSAAEVVIAARKLNAFVDKIAKACQVDEKMVNRFEYQLIGDGSCAHSFNIHSVTLLCNVVERSCQLDFLFQ